MRHVVGNLMDNPSQLGAFRLRRSKYKPGTRLTAYYDITLAGSNNAKPNHRLIEVDWRPNGAKNQFSEGSDFLDKQGTMLQEDAVRLGLAAPFRQLAAELPQLGVRIQVYPLDAHFPQLVRLSNPDYVRESLQSAGLINGVARDKSTASNLVVLPIRYRPGERHVLRFDWTETKASVPTRIAYFAKLYEARDEGQRRMKVSTMVADWLDRLDLGVTAARPATFLGQDNTLLYPMIPGVPLSQALQRPGRKIARSLCLAGAALRALHDSPSTMAEGLPPKTLESEIKVIRRAAQHIDVLLPEVGYKISHILEQIKELHQRLPHEPLTFTHSDFKADHLRISNRLLTLIDFDTCSLADPASDIGKFMADLRFWYEVYGAPGVEHLQGQFLSGYGLRESGGRMLRAYLYEVLVLIKITIRRVPLFDRRWAERTETLVEQSDLLLKQLAGRIGG
jgi:hypothetical protein